MVEKKVTIVDMFIIPIKLKIIFSFRVLVITVVLMKPKGYNNIISLKESGLYFIFYIYKKKLRYHSTELIVEVLVNRFIILNASMELFLLVIKFIIRGKL